MYYFELGTIAWLFGVVGFFIGSWFLVVGGGALMVGWWIVVSGKNGFAIFPAHLKTLIPIILIFISISTGFLYTSYYIHTHESLIPKTYVNKKVSLVGIVSDDPNNGLSATTITLRVVSINGEPFHDNRNFVQVSLPAHAVVIYGDRIVCSGKLKNPESFTTDTGRTFDYPHYLLVHHIAATLTTSSYQVLDHHEQSRIVLFLFNLKNYFVSEINTLLPSPESGLFAGIIIGEQSLLPKDNLAEFQIAGLTHMIVLSGYNITIVVQGVMTLLAWCGLGYRSKRIGALGAIPFFIIMTGMGASSVRAGIMSGLVLLLQITTRPSQSFRIILLVLIVMIMSNPPALLYDPSLHMSFLAFVGLVYITPVTEYVFHKWSVSEWFGLRDLLIETLSVQLFVLPYILWMSGRISLLIVFSNLLTVPMVPWCMGVGFITVIVGMVWYPAGHILSLPIHGVMTYFLSIAHLVSISSLTTFIIPPFGGWVMAGIYGIIVWLLYFLTYRKIAIE